MEELKEFALWWVASLMAATTVALGRIGYSLYRLSPDEPEDPIAAKHWLRRRRWLVFSELSALPAFATFAVVATVYWGLNPIVCVGISMALGGVGFVLLLDALQFIFRQRLGLPEGNKT